MVQEKHAETFEIYFCEANFSRTAPQARQLFQTVEEEIAEERILWQL